MLIMNAGTDADLALAAAQAGAAVVRGMYGMPLTRFEKSAGDFATAADLAAEKVILDVIHTPRPGDAMMGEESGRTGADGTERIWLVDPLCGTFVERFRPRVVSTTLAVAGSAPGVEPPMSPTAICATVCTSPVGSRCAKPPAVS